MRAGGLVIPLLTFALITTLAPVLASEPGEPLSCEDFEILIDGLWVTTVPDSEPGVPGKWNPGPLPGVDLDGNLYGGRGTLSYCGTAPLFHSWMHRAKDGHPKEDVLVAKSRCVDSATGQVDHVSLDQGFFDIRNGTIRLRLHSSSRGPAKLYPDTYRHCLLRGLTTIYDLLETVGLCDEGRPAPSRATSEE